MRPVLALLGLAALLLGLAAAQGWGLLYTLGYALLLTLVISYLWSIASVRGIYVRPRAPILRSQVGAVVEERAEIENLTWLPRPWLEVLDGGDHPEHNLSEVLSLGPLGQRARRIRTRLRRRGRFTLGPVWLAGGDPFGLFRRERRVSGPSTLIVFPASVELPAFGNLPGELSGGSLRGERVHHVTSNVSSVRDYQPGDSFSRVHWPSTARRGGLMVKEFERDPLSDLWLILDLDPLVQVGIDGSSHDPASLEHSTEEYAVTIAASLGRHFLLRDRAVGIVVPGHRLPADRGPRQLLRLLELLAVARAARGQSLDELLLAEMQRFGRRDTLVVVTPTTEYGWVSLCRDLARRGVRGSAVVLDGATFGPAPSSQAVLAALEVAAMPTYCVRRGDDLAAVLGRPSLHRG